MRRLHWALQHHAFGVDGVAPVAAAIQSTRKLAEERLLRLGHPRDASFRPPPPGDLHLAG
ncbi:MAG: hypothetical protein MUC96_20350 [Myxococcaceae bacterium]|jgi:hypothetical protein|nr:hypothetical protein [Myxococcaceae bacterium]